MPAVSPSPSRECGGTAGGRQCQQVVCGGTQEVGSANK